MNGLNSNTNPWDDEADGVFFALTATLFAPSYTYGAGVLLASYDDECETAVSSAPAAAPATTAAAVTASTNPVTASVAE